MKIGYKYNGNIDYIKQLTKYNLYILIENEGQLQKLQGINANIVNIKNNKYAYDILISEKEDIDSIRARRKFVIGSYQKKQNNITYIQEFDLNKILSVPKVNNYKFSIIVPNYNNGEWINRTIESVLGQTYDNWEMYIIDDVSTDNSIEVISSYKDKRIKLIQNKIKWYNGGSRNWGILAAKESNPDGYLLFIDSDDWLYNNTVLEDLNNFIFNEDLITLDFIHYKDNNYVDETKCYYQNIDELFMTQGIICAVWSKCFKVSIAPLFEFNTLMEDRNYHYRLINKINTYANLGKVTYVWNKMNKKSITTDEEQQYTSNLQATMNWNNCAYRHIAGMLDLLDEIKKPIWKDFINRKIVLAKRLISNNQYHQI